MSPGEESQIQKGRVVPSARLHREAMRTSSGPAQSSLQSRHFKQLAVSYLRHDSPHLCFEYLISSAKDAFTHSLIRSFTYSQHIF